MIEDEIRNIRKQLRLAMNGVVSTSMREKGIVYKLNFGASLPEIREIAKSHIPQKELAAALWREDVRELKIIATYLQPADNFSKEQAWQWAKEIPYQEIAEQCCRNLFCKLTYAVEWAVELFNADMKEFKMARTVSFLLWTELFKHGVDLSIDQQEAFCSQVSATITSADNTLSLNERMNAITAMKFYGRKSKEQALAMLALVKNNKSFFASAMGQEIYDDLHFEFEFNGILE